MHAYTMKTWHPGDGRALIWHKHSYSYIYKHTNIHTICPMYKTVAEDRMLIRQPFCLGL